MGETNGAKEPRTIVGNFDITLNLAQDRQMKMSGYVYSDDTKKDINARVDLFQETIDRQFIRTDLINKRAQIAAHMMGIKQVRDQYDDLVRRQKAGAKLSSQDKLKVDNCQTHMQRGEAEIASLQAAIKVGEEKLAAT